MNDDLINASINEGRLKLSLWETITHYSFVGFLVLIPITLLLVFIRRLLIVTEIVFNWYLFMFIAFSALTAFISYKIQKNRLHLKVIKNNLPPEKIDSIIEEVAQHLKWNLTFSNEKALIFKTYPGFVSGSWGEQITILFYQKNVYINSICDPNKQSSIFSAGRNSRNMKTLILAIEKGNATH